MTNAGAAGKPAVETLGIDLASLAWRQPGSVAAGSSGAGGAGVTDPGLAGALGPDLPPGDAIEVAVSRRPDGETWVLVRVTGDPAGRVLVYDQHEWECFLDGVRKGEFDEGG